MGAAAAHICTSSRLEARGLGLCMRSALAWQQLFQLVLVLGALFLACCRAGARAAGGVVLVRQQGGN